MVRIESWLVVGASRQTDEAPEILSGWKDIAKHLGKGVRTVQRYESSMGLPIRRPAGHQRGSVIATKSELNAWVSASPRRDVFKLTTVSLDSFARYLSDVKKGTLEMSALRDQMRELRAELRCSLQDNLQVRPLRVVLGGKAERRKA